ncbi:hypothetical protein CASFOL_019569 [Castilleja foliolosa]|uniref:Phorbol-ester/DAG-type domain-containing protein n=1 Tax=Castilleja foliolosa TaxID=1961234 RepID=A0ABD3D8N6_9LAMI
MSLYTAHTRGHRRVVEADNKIDPDDGNTMVCNACCVPIFSTPFITTVDPGDHNNNHPNVIMHDQCANDHLPPRLEGRHPYSTQEPQAQADGYQGPSSSPTIMKTTSIATHILFCSHIPIYSIMAIVRFVVIGTTENTKIRGFMFVSIVVTMLISSAPFMQILITFLSSLVLLIREAQIPNLVRLPMPNEHTSVMNTILTNYVFDDATSISIGDHTSTSIATGSDDHQSDGSKLFVNNKIHEHPLIFHEDNHHPEAGVARVCNACVQLISPSDPFYSCANNNNNNNNNELVSPCCKDFFLHRCCAHLPTTLFTQHSSHGYKDSHPLTLLSKVNNRFNMFRCRGCRCQCNGFAYACVKCDNYYLDVVFAFMHTSITHDGHAKSHILHPPKYFKGWMCIRCGNEILIYGEIGYECNSCLNFSLHARCALLPDTITHKFDRHPLKLLIPTQSLIDDNHLPLVVKGGGNQEEEEKTMFCEICEDDMDDKHWHYGCKECDQYFHVDCIPYLDHLSRIKFGFTSTARVTCHDCPLECVRAVSVDGYRCRHCQEIIRESNKIAFECSDCYFRIHEECAKKLIK